MFSIIFPGQGSQSPGMCKDLYLKYNLIKEIFKKADNILDFNISDIILEGPKEKLNLTENTQPAIFLVGYSIFSLLKKEFKIKFSNVKYFAGHSLGEYTALCAAGYLNFEETLRILKKRGQAMQNSMPQGQGGMLAVLGSSIEQIEKLLNENTNKYKCFIANDNSDSQIVLSGKIEDLEKLSIDLKKKLIKNIMLPVSAPFHCELMSKATEIMKKEINNLNFQVCDKVLVSNVTATKMTEIPDIKNLLIKQIESRVRWRESIKYMVEGGTEEFIEIGPGKVLSGLIKRIDKKLKVSAINNEEDINIIKNKNEF